MKQKGVRKKDSDRTLKTVERRSSQSDAHPTDEPPTHGPVLWRLILAGLLVLAFYGGLRIGIDQPWGYDDYYHLGVAREFGHQFPLRAFPWTPFSILAERYADKEPLFHLVLMPIAGLPVGTAGHVGALLGQAFLIAAMAWFLWSRRVPGAAGWLLCLTGLGPFFALRLEQVRPHVWMLAFCVLVLTLLLRGVKPWVLAVVCALFGLSHTAGWVAVPFAVAWSLAGRFAPVDGERRLELVPVLAAAGGWLAGQLVHPNLPHNFWLVWTQNVVVPLASTGTENRGLKEAIGIDLLRPSALFLLEQWPLFIAPAVAVAWLLRRREARTRAALTLVSLTLAFLLVGALQLRRLIEIGGLLGLMALALMTAESVRRGERPPFSGGRRAAAALLLALAVAWTVGQVRDFGRGDLRPLGGAQPLGMAGFLNEKGQAGALVFTAQWGDSAPLFYAAPKLKSLVVLDPTFLYAKDPQLFERYWAIAHGRSGDPVGRSGGASARATSRSGRLPAFSLSPCS